MHTTGGYLTGVAATTKDIFDLRDDDVYWCTADVGWVTGHSYVVYGPLANGADRVHVRGRPRLAPPRPLLGTHGEVRRHRSLHRPDRHPRLHEVGDGVAGPKHDMGSLRLLGSVGEPINPEAWLWYHAHIGGGRCPIVDTWWQTETGAIMIAPLPGLITTKPASASRPFPGIAAEVVDEQGNDAPGRARTRRAFWSSRSPWPSMLRTLWGDDDRYRKVYWSKFPDQGYYFPGDGARRDEDGDYWLLGRVDDIMLVAGHNISTMEVESALVDASGRRRGRRHRPHPRDQGPGHRRLRHRQGGRPGHRRNSRVN